MEQEQVLEPIPPVEPAKVEPANVKNPILKTLTIPKLITFNYPIRSAKTAEYKPVKQSVCIILL